jgi:general secretion pathway protein F
VVFAKWRAREPEAAAPVPAPPARASQAFAPTRGARVSARRRALLFRQLALLERAGVPLLAALRTAAEREPSEAARAALLGASDEIGRGAALHEAVAPWPALFDPLAVELLAAAELSGRLAAGWDMLAERAELRVRVLRELSLALFYPVLLLVAGCFLLPLRVLILEGTGAYLRAALLPLAVLGGAAGALAALRALLGPSPRASAALHRVPLLGTLFARLGWARATGALADLLEAGLPAGPALAHAGAAAGSAAVDQAVRRAAEAVSRGATLASAFEGVSAPVTVLQVIAAGERSGTLPDSLRAVSRGELESAMHGLKIAVRIAVAAFALGVFAYLGWRTFAQATEVRETLERTLDQVLDGDGVRRAIDQFRELQRALE